MKQRIGLFIYLIGLMAYLLAWREIILFPSGMWSSSLAGFTSLAYTPVIMLFGIGIIGNQLFVKFSPVKLLYWITAAALIILQTGHALLIFRQNV